ncbi:hybrid sensor histidine kinase/response regulator transcription factor [Mariniflexile sp.]|uniref:hybrid sensor histidine kinase/response regulator transcription factor n=1 Tax=Mariniflexile sp. TaxID=1979402 RepID=UPI00404884E9
MDLKQFKIIFYIILSIACAYNTNAQNYINIKHITPQYNNKNVHVFQVSQDSIGNIWMNTIYGILKYNGYSYTLIKNNEIFPDDRIDIMYSGQSKNIWIKSIKGSVCYYNSSKGVFTPIDGLPKNSVSVIKPVKNGLLIATKVGEIYTYFNKKIEKIFTIPNINEKNIEIWDTEIVNDTEFYASTSQGKIFNYSLKTKKLNELTGLFTNYPQKITLQTGTENRLWIATEAHGLFVYDILKKEFIQNYFLKGHLKNIEKELFLNMFHDSNGIIWAGTDGGGLYKINETSGSITVFKNKYPNEFSLSGNTIMDISEDSNENIWIVTNHGEVNVIPKPNEHIGYNKGSVNDIPLRILSIYKSSKGTLWVGTDGNGLVRIDNNNTEKEYFNDIDNNFYIQSIAEDNDANIWFGTYRNGLWKYNPITNTFKRIPVINKLNEAATDVRTVFKDSKGRIWAGTNTGLNVYSSNEGLIASFGNMENGLNGTYFESIFEDQDKTIWIGQVKGGLFKFNENPNDIENSLFTGYSNPPDNSLIRVRDMCQGKQGEIWFIDEKLDLNLFNSKTGKFKDFKDLFPNNELNFSAIIAQDENNLWLSSTNGIHHFDLITKKLDSYYTSDGLQEDFHITRSKFMDNNGLMYFGSDKGFHYFNPNKLKKTLKKGKLYVNSIDILNKPAKDIIPNQITTDIFNVDHLNLKNDQSSFSVRFAAINNILNPNYYYSYKLIGFDNDWKSTYYEGLATYTNIPPGDYTLKIKANERDQSSGILEKEIKVSIAYPFWKTTFAYVIYGIILFVIIFTASKWYLLRRKLLINKISRRKKKELHSAKMDFFTKMSHEIQTPITLILSPIQNMIENAETNGNLLLKERLNVISNNAQRLSRIARELTLVRNKELKKLKLHVTQNNLYEDIYNIALSFKELARIKKIDFNTNCPKNLDNTWYDKEKLEHILYNIIDNAFKFTPQEGFIQLNIIPIKNNQFIKISVTDTGSGISENELENIFKLFYRTNNDAKGMGIGLALTKELVDVHKGKIRVKSSKSEGTIFTVKIPVAENAYLDSEKITSSKKIENNQNFDTPNTELKETINFDSSKTTVLIVEDNFELQNFLKGLLSEQYNVLLAENGKEGYYHAKNNLPDLIISDIMMPEMDGIELCEKLLKDSLTKHIPIILLTAKNSTETKITGLKAGAIEYINKPFNSNELLLKINNILIRKESIISKYRKELINSPQINIEQSQDEVFLEHLNSIVNDKLNDPDFKVDDLAEKLNMSHSSLYRKCSTLTGLSLIDYIREQRVKKAAILLTKYGYNISEVAYMVGFNNPKYFSKCFKNQYGISPKDFCNEAKKVGIDEHLKKHKLENIV